MGGRGRRISEFKASLVYRVISRTARATQRNLFQKTKSKNKNKTETYEQQWLLKTITKHEPPFAHCVKHELPHCFNFFLSFSTLFLRELLSFLPNVYSKKTGLILLFLSLILQQECWDHKHRLLHYTFLHGFWELSSHFYSTHLLSHLHQPFLLYIFTFWIYIYIYSKYIFKQLLEG